MEEQLNISDLDWKTEREGNELPAITFQVSQNPEDIPYNDILLDTKDHLEPTWREIEAKVLNAFEDVTGGKWDAFSKTNGIPVTLTATEGSSTRPHEYLKLGCREIKSRWAKQQGLLGTIRDSHSLQGSLIHELAHNFMSAEDIGFMRKRFRERLEGVQADLNESGFFNEVYAELSSQAVHEREFSREESSPWIERQRLGHRGVYDFIDTLSDDEKLAIVDRRHPSRINSIDDQIDSSRKALATVRSKLSNVFRRK